MGLVVFSVWSSGVEPSNFTITNRCMMGTFPLVLLVPPSSPPGRCCLTSVSTPLFCTSMATVLLVPYPCNLLSLPLRRRHRPNPPIEMRT